ncbi:alpha/beta fold hydrolase [Streptomyces sp. ST2-7A]|uniref:alpha/beta fold hydrolase n=1 Tax=Streptomyces sp. ST2-7A TaxID=2907214 RepID=UPI0035AC24B9
MSSTRQQRYEAAAMTEDWPGVREGETFRPKVLPGAVVAVRRRAATRADAEPAFFVHGLGGSSRNWSSLMERLAGDVDCEALDLPGFGASPPPGDGDYSLPAHTRRVIRCLEASGRGPVHLFGNSLGGAAATRVAAQRPDLVRSLTLISPALPELRPQRTAVPTALLGAPGASRLMARLTRDYPPERRARDVLRLCYGDPERITERELAVAVAEQERRQTLPWFWDALGRTATGIFHAYTLGGPHSLWRQAERVLAPTLLVYGGRDRLVGFRMARRAAIAFRDSRTLALPTAGHVAMMEFPDAVADAFRELRDGIDGRPGAVVPPVVPRSSAATAPRAGSRRVDAS